MHDAQRLDSLPLVGLLLTLSIIGELLPSLPGAEVLPEFAECRSKAQNAALLDMTYFFGVTGFNTGPICGPARVYGWFQLTSKP
jgi:hypothetical protein